ncbi:hypothetical protein A6J66_001135 [Yersinia enterocolitica]|nr:hypothetical protein A6J66_001135 [Yersinia enterocolitica]
MTRSADRQQLMLLVQEAVDSGASLTKTCQRVGLSQRTLQRWRTVSDDRRATSPRPVPKNKLSAEDVQQVLAVCHEPRFASTNCVSVNATEPQNQANTQISKQAQIRPCK